VARFGEKCKSCFCTCFYAVLEPSLPVPRYAFALPMKNPLLLASAIMAGAFTASSAALPGAPEANGLAPKTATLFVNGTNNINNGTTEALGVGIAGNGNVLVGWEDDGPDITNY